VSGSFETRFLLWKPGFSSRKKPGFETSATGERLPAIPGP
jgi:hypothetical protein